MFPWWEKRKNPNAKPKHFIISRQADLSGLVTLTFHTAGENYIWDIPLHYLINHQRLRKEIAAKDLEYLEWMIREDIGVPTQYWTCTDLKKILKSKIYNEFLEEIK